MIDHFDVAVVGGGIVGLAHAWRAARRGLRVVLFERTASAAGASIRNFGMIWPIGQPAGERYERALRARELWQELGELGVLAVQDCGAIHLAHNADELAVLEEFCARRTHAAEMLSASEIQRRAPLANPTGLLGGMSSSTELRVDPRTACASVARWLAESHSVQCHFQTAITQVEGHTVYASDGRKWSADRVIVCSGSDLRTLFPDVFARSELRLCKLQMLKAVAQPPVHRQAAHLASGLTLRHYESFRDCSSMAMLRTRIATETPELDHFGIHVMASQIPSGEVILGDSHEYGDAVSPFDKPVIDELILRELRKVICLKDWTIQERWHGIYAKHLELPVFETAVDQVVTVFVGTGGAGMTMAFGLAEQAWNQWMGGSK